MSAATTRVIKVGGSLLDWPELPARLWQWLARQPLPAANYLLAGGGEIADFLRKADLRFRLGDEISHALCLEGMRTTGKLLEHLLAQGRAAHGEIQARIEVLDVPMLLASPEIGGRVAPLPASWDVTSDSIAAHLAEAFGATELVLLKSTSLRGSRSHADAAAAGYVDPYFPIAAQRVRKTRFVNLRDEGMEWMLF